MVATVGLAHCTSTGHRRPGRLTPDFAQAVVPFPTHLSETARCCSPVRTRNIVLRAMLRADLLAEDTRASSPRRGEASGHAPRPASSLPGQTDLPVLRLAR